LFLLTPTHLMNLPVLLCVDRQALNNLDAILAIDGCDGVFVGPADLSISLSNGSECNMDNQAVAEAKKKVVAAASRAGKISGIYWYLVFVFW
jgi:4-hydroxy-2-oxoheptanedioate aldolase